jgi:hypothetical protein
MVFLPPVGCAVVGFERSELAAGWRRRGQLILALSGGPSVEFMVYRYSTSAGSPHRMPPSLSI